MENKLMKSYLDNIGELVIDEDKIITYKSLSRTLGIHVNTAKQLLYTYLTRQKAENLPLISATYLLAGKLEDGSFHVTVVNECDLENTYKKFVEITSEHIYSIQKGKTVKDIQILSGIGKDSPNDKSSGIVLKCLKSIIKSKNDNKKKSEPLVKENTCKAEVKAKFFGVQSDNKSSKNEVANLKGEVSVKKSEEATNKSPKKVSPSDKSKANSGKNKETLKKQKGSITNFFENSTQRIKENSYNVEKNTSDSNNQKENENSATPDDTENLTSKVKGKDKTNQNSSNAKGKDKTNQNSSNVKESEKENSEKKKKGNKRKRIQIFSDSEDSDSDEDMSPVEVEVPKSPVPVSILEDAKEEVNEEKPLSKRKKRKIVDKTIMNEDGYLETKKEVVLGTDSEDEVDEESPSLKRNGNELKKTKLDKVSDKKVAASNAMKKQSSLLTFFKKN